MKQRPRLRRPYKQRQRFSLGDFVMPSHNFLNRRTVVVSFKFFDSTTAVVAALPVVEELIRQLQSEQQRQQITHLQLSAQIDLTFSFHGSETATATLAQAIDDSAYQLEELRNAKQIADFAVKYKLLR